MNNIELRLYAERNWREENYLHTKHSKEQNTMKNFVVDVMNQFPAIFYELLNANLTGVSDNKVNLAVMDTSQPCQEKTTGLLKFISKKKRVALPR